MSAIRTRGELIRWLLEREDAGAFCATFSEIHRAGHYLCPDPDLGHVPGDEHDRLLHVYRAFDESLGRMLEVRDRDETSVVLFALHGMGPNNSQIHFLPQILKGLGTGAHVDAGDGERSIATQRSLARFLRFNLPARVQHLIASNVSQAVRDWVTNHAYAGGHAWKRTLSFDLLSGGQGYIRLNARNREKAGIIDRDSAASRSHVDALRAALLTMRDAEDGTHLVDRIIDVDDVLGGPARELLPDLIVTWKSHRPSRAVIVEGLGTLRATLGTGRGGNHRPHAFALVHKGAQAPEPRSEPSSITELGRLGWELAGLGEPRP